MIATNSDAKQNEAVFSPLIHWKCQKAIMHSKRFCRSLLSRQSNWKISFSLTVSDKSSTCSFFKSSYYLPLPTHNSQMAP